MNEFFAYGFEKSAGLMKEIDKLKTLIGGIKEHAKPDTVRLGRSFSNSLARAHIDRMPLIGKSEILKGLAGGAAQNKVKDLNLEAIGKNIAHAGKEMKHLVETRPGRVLGETAIGGGLLYAGKKISDSNRQAAREKKIQEQYAQSM